MSEAKYTPPSAITKDNVNCFPFTMPHDEGHRHFISYVFANRDELDAKHGRIYYTGNTERDKKPSFIWNDVDVSVRSDTMVKFTVYDSAESFSTQRGKVILVLDIEYDPEVLAPHIDKQQMKIAEKVLDARAAEAARLQRMRDIEKVRAELFGAKTDEAVSA